MPTRVDVEHPYIHSVLFGRLTDDELLAHYDLPPFLAPRKLWLEIVDAREVTDMQVTVVGQQRLADVAARRLDRLRGGRVAMVAPTDLIFGMFRMWELRREELNYEVRVYRSFEEAVRWISLFEAVNSSVAE